MFRFQPSVESLETRENPSGTALASVTDMVLDSYYGTGVYKSVDSGKTWTLASDVAPKADPLPVLLVIANQDIYSPVEPVGDLVAGGGDPGVATGGTIPVYWHVIGRGSAASDDVVIDGKVIAANDDGSAYSEPRTFATEDSTAEGGITKLGSRRLILQGDGTYTGETEGETITIGGLRTEAPTGAGGTFTLTFNGQTTT